MNDHELSLLLVKLLTQRKSEEWEMIFQVRTKRDQIHAILLGPTDEMADRTNAKKKISSKSFGMNESYYWTHAFLVHVE